VAERADLGELARELRARFTVIGQLSLSVGGCAIVVDSNSAALLEVLRDYFRAYGVRPTLPGGGKPDIHITALDADEPELGLSFSDWPRDAGKSGRKDTYVDIPGGRVVRKVRTGMQFLIGEDTQLRIAIGRALKNVNQIINLVNSQYMAWLLARGHLMCHAAGVERQGAGLGMAGISGAGKSTLALHLISSGMNFVSNDRLLLGRRDGILEMRGVPKMPRINPGTILANEDLRPIIDEEKRSVLQELSPEALWELEEKYDADIERVYGDGRVTEVCPIEAFVVLTWSFKNAQPTRLVRSTLAERTDLLPAIMKHPGPFVLHGEAWGTTNQVDRAPYLALMGELPVLEFSGGVDFELAVAECRGLLPSDER